MNGKITIGRTTSNKPPFEYAFVELIKEDRTLIRISIPMEQFSRVILGQSRIPCEYIEEEIGYANNKPIKTSQI